MGTSSPVANRFDSCPRCREDKEGLAQLEKLFNDKSTSSADLIAYLKQTTIPNDVIEEFFALPATDKKVVQYVYKTGLYALSCMDCDISPARQDYMYSAAFEASLNVEELDSLTLKTISMELCGEVKATLEEFRSNEWYVSFPLAQILNDSDAFHEFASDSEFQEADRKRLRNCLSTLLKFEGHWNDDGECLSGDAGVAIFDNVKFALSILDKPTRKAKAAGSKSRKLKQKSTAAVVDEFTKLATSRLVDDRRAAASDPNISLKWLKVLSKDKDENVRGAIADNPRVTRELLKVLAWDRSEWVGCVVASNPMTPVPTLKELAKEPNENIRSSVCENKNLPIKILRMLAKDDSAQVRCAVARNERTTASLMVALAHDSDDNVRQSVAENPKVPVELLEVLSRDQVSIIRWCVASNSSTPIRILRKLWRDEDSYVREHVAGNPSISQKVLLEILDEAQKLTRERAMYVSAVAGNSKIPTEVLVALSKDKDEDVRSSVAGNPKTPIDVLVALSKDKNKWVRRVVAENVKTPQEILRVLARERLPKNEFSGTNVRAAVAGNPRCPEDLLESLAKDKSAEIRRLVAGNPSSNAETLMLLARDSDGDVRGAVRSNDSASLEIKAFARTFRFAISD